MSKFIVLPAAQRRRAQPIVLTVERPASPLQVDAPLGAVTRRSRRAAPIIVQTGASRTPAVISISMLDQLAVPVVGRRRIRGRAIVAPWDWGIAINFAPPPTATREPTHAPQLVRRAVRRSVMPFASTTQQTIMAFAITGTPGRHPLRVSFTSMTKSVDFS